MVTTWAYLALVAGVGVQRLVELRRAKENVRWALEHGGREVGKGHYPVMVALHTAFLVSCGAEVVFLHRTFPGALGWLALVGVLLAQALRQWAMETLGPRWTTRIVVVPGLPPVTGGPYRFLRHPNYLAVALELALLPLVQDAWITAVVFSLANGALLAVRIRSEERALGAQWQSAFAARPRFVPGGPRG